MSNTCLAASTSTSNWVDLAGSSRSESFEVPTASKGSPGASSRPVPPPRRSSSPKFCDDNAAMSSSVVMRSSCERGASIHDVLRASGTETPPLVLRYAPVASTQQHGSPTATMATNLQSSPSAEPAPVSPVVAPTTSAVARPSSQCVKNVGTPIALLRPMHSLATLQHSHMSPPPLFISRKNPALYRKEHLLGEGGCGSVWQVERTRDGAKLAAKIVLLKPESPVQTGYALAEPRFMAQCHSPFVIRYEDCWTNKKRAVITVMEYADGPDLGTHLHNLATSIEHHTQQIRRIAKGLPERSSISTDATIIDEVTPLSPLRIRQLEARHPEVKEHVAAVQALTLSEDNALILFAQIVVGMHHVHSQGIVHRDMKSGNVFLSTNGLLKIGDFGLSCSVGPTETRPPQPPAVQQSSKPFISAFAVGTPCYMAPELWCTQEMPPYSTKSDMWALGVMLFELLTRRRPFSSVQPGEAIVARTVPDVRPYAPDLSDEAIHLLHSLLAPAPSERPSALQVLRTPIMTRTMRMLIRVIRDDPSIDPALASSVVSALTEV